jgi:hypothetical protein
LEKVKSPTASAAQAAPRRLAGATSLPAAVRRAYAEPARALELDVRGPVEAHARASLGDVRVHEGPAASAAAAALDARAFTLRSDIFLGEEGRRATGPQRRELLTHEALHAAQQGAGHGLPDGVVRVSSPSDRAEVEARRAAATLAGARPGSPALALRDSLRPATPFQPAPAGIQRDITGSGHIGSGDFVINFKDFSGATAGEDGTISFTPSATSPESEHIRFIQIARVLDTTTGAPLSFASVAPSLAPLDRVSTTADGKKNVAGGFAVDQQTFPPARATKAAPSIEPFYDVTGPPIAGNATGVHKGKTRTAAVLEDHPSLPAGRKVNFVSSVKGSDNGIFYGTALWGFETFNDKGTTKVKNEYHSFRAVEGETMRAALHAFDEFFRNPGSATAPTK